MRVILREQFLLQDIEVWVVCCVYIHKYIRRVLGAFEQYCFLKVEACEGNLKTNLQ